MRLLLASLMLLGPLVAVGLPGDHGIHVDEDGSRRNLTCKDDVLTVSGSGNRLHVSGHCADVFVNGNGNTIELGRADHLTIEGNGNSVTLPGPADRIRDLGNGNHIRTLE